jgi:hypothetical protein
MNKGHAVIKIEKNSRGRGGGSILPTTKRTIKYKRDTAQILLDISDSKPLTSKFVKFGFAIFVLVDLRTVKEVHTFEHRHRCITHRNINKEIELFDQAMIMSIMFGDGFILNQWTLLCEKKTTIYRVSCKVTPRLISFVEVRTGTNFKGVS